MPTLPVYLTSQEFLQISQIAANKEPAVTPESIGQDVIRTYLKVASKGPREIVEKGKKA